MQAAAAAGTLRSYLQCQAVRESGIKFDIVCKAMHHPGFQPAAGLLRTVVELRVFNKKLPCMAMFPTNVSDGWMGIEWRCGVNHDALLGEPAAQQHNTTQLPP